jgi:uncharacterized membrane protein YbhN (UPF0104 family)
MTMSTLMTAYLIGALVTFIGVVLAVPHLDFDSGARWRHALAALGGVIWPVLILGLIQLGILVAAVNAYRRTLEASPKEQPTSYPLGV